MRQSSMYVDGNSEIVWSVNVKNKYYLKGIMEYHLQFYICKLARLLWLFATAHCNIDWGITRQLMQGHFIDYMLITC